MKQLEAGGKLVTLYGAVSSAEPCPVVFLNTVMDEGEKVYIACRKLGAPPFVLAAVSRVNWSDDMTPWPAEAVAKWESRCGGMADLYISKLENEIVPAVCDALPFSPVGSVPCRVLARRPVRDLRPLEHTALHEGRFRVRFPVVPGHCGVLLFQGTGWPAGPRLPLPRQ